MVEKGERAGGGGGTHCESRGLAVESCGDLSVFVAGCSRPRRRVHLVDKSGVGLDGMQTAVNVVNECGYALRSVSHD